MDKVRAMNEHYLQGRDALVAGNVAEARDAFVEALRQEPGNIRARIGYAMSCQSLKDYERAVEAYGEVIQRAQHLRLIDRASLAVQRDCLCAAARKVCSQLDGKLLAWREVFERQINVVVHGARLVLLQVGDGDLTVGNLQLTERQRTA